MKKFKIMNLIICLILLTSCNKKGANDNMNYFDFDDIEYYNKNVSKKDVLIEYEKSKSINYDNNYLKIIENEYPIKLDDKEFITNMVKFGYLKKQVNKSEHSLINKIFSKNNCTELTTNGCIPIFRDILIFKKKGIIVGIAKVCFECRTAHIIGSKQNWDYFGECGDYEKLQEILKSIK